MHQIGPEWRPDPQSAATTCTETPLPATFPGNPGFTIDNPGPIDADILPALYFQRIEIAAEIDGISAAATGFAAYGAVAEIERIRMSGLDTKPHFAAMA